MDPGSSSSLQPSKDTEDLPVEKTPKKYSVELYFNPELENLALKVWNRMADGKVSRHLIDNKSRPHVTLLQTYPVDGVKLENVLKSVSSTKDLRLPLSFDKTVSLPKDNNMFVGVTRSASLLEFHSKLYDAMKKEGIEIRQEYRPDKWVPYCLTAQGGSIDFRLLKAFDISDDLKKATGFGMEIGLVEYEPDSVFEMDPGSSISLQPSQDTENFAVEKTPKNYAVELYFDRELENRVLKVWDRMADSQVSRHLIDNKSRPNLTLLKTYPVDGVKLENVLKSVVSTQELRLPLSFNKTGSFQRDNSIVYVGVTRSAPLLEFHSKLYDAMKKEGIKIRQEYQPDKWFPYCLTAQGGSIEYRIMRAFDISDDLKQASGFGKEIGLVEFQPDQVTMHDV